MREGVDCTYSYTNLSMLRSFEITIFVHLGKYDIKYNIFQRYQPLLGTIREISTIPYKDP